MSTDSRDFVEVAIRYPRSTSLAEIAADMAILDRRLRLLPDRRFEAVEAPGLLARLGLRVPSILRRQAG